MSFLHEAIRAFAVLVLFLLAIFNIFACNARVIVDASSSPPVFRVCLPIFSKIQFLFIYIQCLCFHLMILILCSVPLTVSFNYYFYIQKLSLYIQ